MQPKPQTANYSNGAKTIAYYENESFTPYPENRSILVGNKGTVFDSLNDEILSPGQPIPTPKAQFKRSFGRMLNSFMAGTTSIAEVADRLGVPVETTTKGKSTTSKCSWSSGESRFKAEVSEGSSGFSSKRFEMKLV